MVLNRWNFIHRIMLSCSRSLSSLLEPHNFPSLNARTLERMPRSVVPNLAGSETSCKMQIVKSWANVRDCIHEYPLSKSKQSAVPNSHTSHGKLLEQNASLPPRLLLFMVVHPFILAVVAEGTRPLKRANSRQKKRRISSCASFLEGKFMSTRIKDFVPSLESIEFPAKTLGRLMKNVSCLLMYRDPSF